MVKRTRRSKHQRMLKKHSLIEELIILVVDLFNGGHHQGKPHPKPKPHKPHHRLHSHHSKPHHGPFDNDCNPNDWTYC